MLFTSYPSYKRGLYERRTYKKVTMFFSISLVAEEVFRVGNFPVTNSLFTMWVGILLFSLMVIGGTRKLTLVPRGFQIVLEGLYSFFLNLCESVLGEKKLAERAMPFIITIFLFVFVGNIFEVIPGVGSIGFFKETSPETSEFVARAASGPGEEPHSKKFIPLFRPGSADLNTTVALALISVITVQAVGIKTLGMGYLKRFFNFTNPINFFVGILELISEFAKIISFSFRLFGNIFAGEVLLAVMLMLVPYFVPIPFYGLELFVAIVQAFVFAMLTLVFIKLAMIPHGGESH